jgi:DcuC family C4-dicarboxylate transporter
MPPEVLLPLAVAVIVGAVVLVVRRIDVRLVLTLAALVLGLLAGNVGAVTSKFLATLASETFVIPICSSMGFAYVLRQTQCDVHLVQFLARPLRRVWFLLIPGAVLVGFVTNIPIVSQAGAASTVGPVMIPLLAAARISPVTSGAALLLGCSMGGEMFNPAAPELQTVVKALREEGHEAEATECVRAAVVPTLIQLAVVVPLFWWLSLAHERRWREQLATSPTGTRETPADFRVNYFKAAIPVVPLVLLFLTGKPLELIPLGEAPGWLVSASDLKHGATRDTRLVGAAMLVGSLLAGATRWREAGASARAFFEGAGHAYATVISTIVAATAFGEGVKVVGIDMALHVAISAFPGLLIPLAVIAPALFAWLCGSGIAATGSLFRFFIQPAGELGVDPVEVGALVSLSSAGGRTMSPVAAVAIIASSLTKTEPFELARRVALPLLAGLTVVILARLMLPVW